MEHPAIKKGEPPLVRLFDLAEWTGLEPATPGVTGRYSNQLNYHSTGTVGLATVAPFAAYYTSVDYIISSFDWKPERADPSGTHPGIS